MPYDNIAAIEATVMTFYGLLSRRFTQQMARILNANAQLSSQLHRQPRG